jgi:desulfoferrodoxin (superoxide reductase-like protein)
MKKLSLLIMALIFATVFAKADAPKKINISYQDGNLKIEVLHRVRNANKHYIDQIVVKVNGKEVKTFQLDKQTSTSSQVSEIELPDLKKGDQIEVTTRCNEFGQKKAKLTL